MTKKPYEFDDVDLKALRRAFDICSRESPARREQLQDMLQERTWFDVAQFAAYSCQVDALNLPLLGDCALVRDVCGGVGGQNAELNVLCEQWEVARSEMTGIGRVDKVEE